LARSISSRRSKTKTMSGASPEATDGTKSVQKPEATLATDCVSKRFGRREVVKEVTITLHAGEIVGLLGPNGAGKTTTFRMIVGLLKPNGGRVSLDGEDVTSLPMYKRARRGIAYLPQDPSVFQKLTVEQNLLAVLEFMPLSRHERVERAKQLMDELSISHLAKNVAETLSGGERRRTEISRALVRSPKFLLLDEPFTGVDPISVTDIQTIIFDLRKKDIGILITDHNVHDTLEITDRAYIINEGEVLKEGTPDEIANDPDVREIYLGDRFSLRQ